MWSLRLTCGGDVGVVGLGGLAQEGGLGEGHPLHERDGGEVDAVRHVAHGPDVVHAGAAVGVHLDGPLLVHLHPDRLQAQPRNVGPPPRGKHDVAALPDIPPLRLQPQLPLPHLLHLHRLSAKVDADALRLQLLRQMLAHLRTRLSQRDAHNQETLGTEAGRPGGSPTCPIGR
jgi:hypothetical protein